MHYNTDDVRIQSLRPLLPPAILMEEVPATADAMALVAISREAVGRILHGHDDRLLVVVGPCSIHDPDAGLEYAQKLREKALECGEDLFIVMRVYFEKPRTTVGWKGLINDPRLDGSFAINEGLRRARRFLADVAALGLPSGTEFLDPISPQFLADLVSWGAIGARTSESQVHRELASGLSMPVGFKNGTDGRAQGAIEAIRSASHPHHFLSVTKQGVAAIVATLGNRDCHLILRGGTAGPNFAPAAIAASVEALQASGLPARLMIDCSHANSGKDHVRQAAVAEDLAGRIGEGQNAIAGVMMESFLVEGRQDHEGKQALAYGQSITDACMSWERTAPLLDTLAAAVRSRRRTLAATA
ncbi:MAG TPA: 3-deoxy-7-phosphoheptulonate synthase [Vicinamibacteria bacterium]|nr:3-deoxy-7-phosphoheptulonate synthase [Vicinamibacteria bacterium]